MNSVLAHLRRCSAPRFAPVSLALMFFTAATCPSQAEVRIIEAGDGPAGAPAATTAVSVPAPTDTATKGAPGEASDVIRFRNRDVLHGRLLSVTADAIRWRHSEAKEMIAFGLANAMEIGLAPRATGPGKVTHQAMVQLTNGDQVRGDLVSLDKDQVSLNTWYAGPVTLRRAMVRSIVPNLGKTESVFAGPTGIEGWSPSGNRDAWTFRNGAFYSVTAGSVGRDVKLPDVAKIEFDVAWRGYPQFIVAFYTDNVEQLYSGGGYALQVSNASVYLQRGRPNQGFSNMDNGAQVEAFQQRNRLRLSLLVDKNKKTIALLANGALVKQWTDPGDFAGRGTGLLFQTHGQGQLRISDLVVSTWDGRLNLSENQTAQEEDLLRLINSDKVSGRLESITKEGATFVTSYATLKVPLERITQIDLAGKLAEVARRQAADIRAQFAGGGQITFALDKLEDKTLAGASENFGKLAFSVDAFRALQFHIYDETERDDEDDWSAAGGSGGQFQIQIME